MMLASVLFLSVVTQSLAAAIAFQQMRETGRYRLAWACVSLALVLMVERRIVPLWRYGEGLPPNVADSLFGLAISLLMLAGLWGIRQLFAEIRRQELELAVLARTDPLTGLANRRETSHRLQVELDRSNRSRHPLSLLMLDLDHFKAVNDTWGHAAGDAVLRAVANVCQAALRTIDVAGRWGGEEFLVVLPDTGSEDALAVAERLRAALAATPVDAGVAQLTVTASIGVATAGPGTAEEVLLARADAALYEAKDGGRNRAVVWRNGNPGDV